MAYAVVDDILRRYNPITTMLGTGTMDISTVDIASIYIADGESIINGYLGKRYLIPLQSEPILTDICADIAIYRTLRDRAPRIPEFMQTRYTDAMDLLKAISSGDMILNSSSQAVNTAGDQEAWSNVIDPGFNGPVFKPAETWSCWMGSNSWC